MLHCLNSVAWLFSKSHTKKQHFSAFKLPVFRTQFIMGPIHSEQLFFLNKTLSQCVFEETQPLPRCQTGSVFMIEVGPCSYLHENSDRLHQLRRILIGCDKRNHRHDRDPLSILGVDGPHLIMVMT